MPMMRCAPGEVKEETREERIAAAMELFRLSDARIHPRMLIRKAKRESMLAKLRERGGVRQAGWRKRVDGPTNLTTPYGEEIRKYLE